MRLEELVEYCDRRLAAADFDDYCPNGLQVEGNAEVTHIVSGVTASLALVDAAIEAGADALLVHHGYFWKGEPAPLVGMKGRRIRRLAQAGMNLLAYHLPLDAHPQLGNNAGLGRALGLQGQPLCEGSLVWAAATGIDSGVDELARTVSRALQREPTVIDVGRPQHRVAWCTGAAQGYITQAAQAGCDTFISGEISEQTLHQARELEINYVSAGHHATERFGVQALGAELAERFGIEHRFIDLPNPA